MMRFLFAFLLLLAGLLAGTAVFAQSSQDDLCEARLLQENRGAGGCVQVSTCSGDNLTQLVTPGESLCDTAAGEVCCYADTGLGGSSQLPPETPATSTGTPTLDTGRGSVNDGRSYLINPLGGRTVPQLIGNIVAWLGTAAGALFFLYLLWGGAEWMMARGDQAQAQRARQRIVAASAGIVVVLLAYTIVSALVGVGNSIMQ